MSKNKQQKTVGIIGLGNFGLLLASILKGYHRVKVYNYSKDQNIRSKADKAGLDLVDWPEIYNCDIVIISTPISITEALIKRVAPNLKKGALLLDVCSVKVYPCQWLEKYTPEDVEIMGTHPMFGPTTTKFDPDKKYWEIKGKQMVLCPLRIRKKRQKEIEKFLKELGLEVIVTTPKDHDHQNAKTLSFVHFLGRSLTRAGITEQKIYTPGYADVLKILPHTNNDNWQLFYDMNNYNPYARVVRRKFLKACFQMEENIIKSNSTEEMEFNREMISEIDDLVFSLLEKRMRCVEDIGKIKKKKGLPAVDPGREKKLIGEQTKRKGLSKDFIEKFYRMLFRESYKKQK